MKTVLPPLPPVPAELLARSDAAHAAVAGRLAAVDPDTGLLARRVLWRRLLESMAGVGSIEFDREQPRVLVPPRRRFLSGSLQGRLDGVAMAMRYIDTRLAMRQRDELDHVVEAETPMVLNAFAESRDPSDRETNAGSIRVTPSTYRDEGALHAPPRGRACRMLLGEMTDAVRADPPVHHLELGAWVALLTFAIHPFVDGNGRTARLLFQAVHSQGLPGGFDWGSIESWSADRMRYIRAIQAATPAGPPDSVAHIVPSEFAEFAAARSIDGAARTAARIDVIEERLGTWREQLGDAAATYAFVAFERNVDLAEFDELGERRHHVEIAEQLVAEGWLRRDALGRYDLPRPNGSTTIPPDRAPRPAQ